MKTIRDKGNKKTISAPFGTKIGYQLIDIRYNRKDLDCKGLSFNEGKIVDASFAEVPKLRRAEGEQLPEIKDQMSSGTHFWIN